MKACHPLGRKQFLKRDFWGAFPIRIKDTKRLATTLLLDNREAGNISQAIPDVDHVLKWDSAVLSVYVLINVEWPLSRISKALVDLKNVSSLLGERHNVLYVSHGTAFFGQLTAPYTAKELGDFTTSNDL